MPTVAGLHSVLEKLARVPDTVAGAAQKAEWAAMASRLPPLPELDGRYAACQDCTFGGTGPGSHHTSNVENPELYCLHPYRMATVARGDKEALVKAKAAFLAKRFPS